MEKVIRMLLDDTEEGEVEADAGTIVFSYQDRTYQIDLSKKNAAKIDSDFQRWIQHARPAGKTTKSAPHTGRKTPGSGYDADTLKAIREWGRKNGYPSVSNRGRVPAEIILAFEQRHEVPSPTFSAKGT